MKNEGLPNLTPFNCGCALCVFVCVCVKIGATDRNVCMGRTVGKKTVRVRLSRDREDKVGQ